MKRLANIPSRAFFLIACVSLLAVGTLAASSDTRLSGEAPDLASATPIAIDDLAVPPHQEPAPPPPPPPAPPPPPPKPLSPTAAFRAAVLGALSGSSAASRAILIDVEGLGHVVEENSSAMVLPASLTKLYTAGSSMLRLGPDRNFRTEVQSYGQLGLDGTLNGSLVLVGGGDPTLTKIDLKALAATLYAVGVRQVSGDLYADDSRFDRARGAPGWKPTYFPDDIGSLSALAVDGNVWRTDPAFYADPATGNLELFRTLLAEQGVAVAGANKLGRADGNSSATLAAHDSAPLGVLLADMLRKSDNFYAELILKELGRTAGAATSADGASVLRSVAGELGVAQGHFVDGSGLSLHNRESPLNIVEWLKVVERIPVGDSLKKWLPTPCSGTKYLLEKRLCGTSAAGRVQAKTGTLGKTRAVAGFTTTASGRKVWMALVLNDVQSTTRAWEAFDRAFVAITSFTR